jgi:ABC-type nickel/cobalt efflux system permease component RcnA
MGTFDPASRRRAIVQNGTACAGANGNNRTMKQEHTKAALTAIWLLAMVVIAYGANITSTASWIALVSFTVIPPIAMWRFWHGPPQTMSESIQEARR